MVVYYFAIFIKITLSGAKSGLFSLEYLSEPIPGKNIYLTIDSAIQFFVEKELQKTINKFKAKGGTVIIMNSQDGAILAMAGYPKYHPHRLK